jgi:hypothetical protein
MTVDHIPPRCLFPRSGREGIISVPACSDCNNGASADDEYFRIAVAFRREAGGHPAVVEVAQTIFRSLRYPEARGLRRRVLDSFTLIRGAEGSARGKVVSGTYEVETARVEKVLQRIFRALYFKATGRRLPPGAQFAFCFDVESQQALIRDASPMSLWKELIDAEEYVMCGGAFTYRGALLEEGSEYCALLLTFYGGVSVLSLTVPATAES